MPLLLLDLDNTLIDRDGAFLDWAESFLAEHGLPRTELPWLLALDGGGHVPRETVLGAARTRYGLARPFAELEEEYQAAMVKHARCPSSHVEALLAARAAGWRLGIATNGDAEHQAAKIFAVGLDTLVDGWAISGEIGYAKPDPELFRSAARSCGVQPQGDWRADTWMVGDHAPADIAGACATGLRSVWLRHGRPWPERHYQPTLSADSLPEAIAHVLSAPAAGHQPSTADTALARTPATGTVLPPTRAAVAESIGQQTTAAHAAGQQTPTTHATERQTPTAHATRPWTPAAGAPHGVRPQVTRD